MDINAPFPADTEATELMQPTQGALHYPSVFSESASVTDIAVRDYGVDLHKADYPTVRI